MTEYNCKTTTPIVDTIPSLPTANNNNDTDEAYDNSLEDSFDYDEPHKKTRRSRRGGYRRKRQQQRKVEALMAQSAARRAQKTGGEQTCDGSTTTTDCESSSGEESSVTGGSSNSNNISSPPRAVACSNNYDNRSININSPQTPVNFAPTYLQTGYHPTAASPPAPVRTPYTNPKMVQRRRTPFEQQSDNFLCIDCEMVGIGRDGTQSALARVSILDWNGNVVMDEYIKPGRKVTDYRSFVSGITPAILREKANMDYATCRKKVIKLLRGKILVGHALENDLGILRINHPWYAIRDTASYQPFMKVRAGAFWPRRLVDLAKEQLNRDVQVYGRPHCPQEDAMAALDLYKTVAVEWEKSMLAYTMNESWMMQQQQQQYAIMEMMAAPLMPLCAM